MTTLLEAGTSISSLPGQKESGDHWLVKEFDGGALVAAVDGCGHGHDAADAARTAIAVLEAQPDASVISLLKRCHERLRGTRGVVMSLASFDALEHTLTWIGVGNVEGVVVRHSPLPDDEREMLLLRAGVVGYSLPPLRATVVPVRCGDTLIFATDGIDSDFVLHPPAQLAPRLLADHLSREYAKQTDDSLVVVARYVGCAL